MRLRSSAGKPRQQEEQHKTRLLDLPDELLSIIILETMWATTMKGTSLPDLELYERRLTNHPSVRRAKVAFVGQICSRLRRLAREHLHPAQLWAEASHRVQIDDEKRPLVTHPAASLLAPSYTAVAFSRGQAVFLPQLPTSALERLTDLSITTDASNAEVAYADTVFQSIGSCKSLRSLFVRAVYAPITPKTLDNLLSAPALQALTVEGLYSTNPIFLPRASSQAALVRLELVWVSNITLSQFTSLVGQLATTLEIGIYHQSSIAQNNPLIRRQQPDPEVAELPRLWRLDIGYGLGAHPRLQGRFLLADRTARGRQDFKEVSLINLWRTAPRLQYFDCSERIVVETQKELDEIGELHKRDGLKRLRLKLDTWKGDKGAGWRKVTEQELVLG